MLYGTHEVKLQPSACQTWEKDSVSHLCVMEVGFFIGKGVLMENKQNIWIQFILWGIRTAAKGVLSKEYNRSF